MARDPRFGFQLSGRYRDDPVGSARRAEDLGFDVVVVSDHVGPGPAPMTTLAAIAPATDSIRLGTMVLNNDMRNPVQLAWEAATLDRLSGGRFELGLGAGHSAPEYTATGIAFDTPTRRKRRLAESVEIMRPLLDGERVDFSGEHHHIDGAQIDAAVQPRLPILVGGNGPELLAHAGAHADIVGLQGLGRTMPDGLRHDVEWDPDRVTTQVGQVRDGAGNRFDQVELSALVQVVEITEDRVGALRAICDRVGDLRPEHATQVPYLMVGSVAEIVEHISACNERWGISYYVVRELEGFAPVISALR